MTKICTKCQQNKPLEEFAVDSRGKLGRRSDCKICNCTRSKAYQKANLFKVLNKNAKWRQNNREHYETWLKQHAPRRRELVKKKYHNDSQFRTKRIQEVRDYRANPENKEKIRLLKRKINARYRLNPLWRLRMNLRRRMSFALHGQRKAATSFKLVGCDGMQLRNYIEAKFQPGMSWDNYGQWHVDHVKPCASFDLSTEVGQRACFHFTNLQPLWATDNLSKGAKV